MSISLQKGAKISLTKEAKSLSNVLVGLGWDVNGNQHGQSFDLDAHAYMLDANGKLPSNKHHIYYGNLNFDQNAVKHQGDNLTGAGDGDDEQILVNLTKIPEDIHSVLFTVVIYRGESKQQYFSQIKNSFVRIEADGTEVCKYDLENNFSKEVVVEVGKLYRHNGEWKFSAVGEGYVSEENFINKIKR